MNSIHQLFSPCQSAGPMRDDITRYFRPVYVWQVYIIFLRYGLVAEKSENRINKMHA